MSLDDASTGGQSGQPHRIGRVQFDVSAKRQDDLIDLRSQIEGAAAQALGTALGRALDAVCPPTDVIRIDQISVDLGLMRPGQPLDLEALQQAIAKAMDDALAFQETGVDAPPGDSPISIGRSDVTVERATAFTTYLQTGRLPAAFPAADLPSLVAALFVDTPTGSEADLILRVLREHRAAMLRALHLMSDAQIRTLLAASTQETGTRAKWQAFLVELSKAKQITTPVAGQQLLAEKLFNLIQNIKDPTSDPDSAPGQTTHALAGQDQAEPLSSTTTPTLLTDAGLVILGPFLPSFFENIGLNPRDDPAHAARLLHVLAHGPDQPFDEPDLLIARILLNIDGHVAVLDNQLPTPDQINEVDQLLDAVISHWTRLGKTSRDGLRETFLRRAGTLIETPKGPLITVEKRGVDVLLSGLPWSISTLHLPWCDGPIQVDWA